MEKCAERDQEEARIFLATCRMLCSYFPLKHLKQLVDPTSFNLTVRRRLSITPGSTLDS
jgi:hypothetical protein